MASRTPPTRADYDRLKAQFGELRVNFEAVRAQISQMVKDARIQFQRIAEMQAVLDEEGRHDAGLAARIHHAKPDGKDGAAILPTVQGQPRRGRGSVR